MTMYRKTEEENELQAVRSESFGKRYREEDLETLLEQNPHVIAEGEPLLLISRQPNAEESGTPDLIALDVDGNVVVVELKRGRTPRDVVAQALEYAAWTSGLDEEDIKSLARDYLAKQAESISLTAAWEEAFGQVDGDEAETEAILPPLNRRQRIVLVLEGRDERVRNVTAYLRNHGIDVNVIEYLYYRTDSGEEFLDIEAVYAPDEAESGGSDEMSLVRQWSTSEQEAYRAYKHALLAGDEQIRVVPKKTGISFYKHTRDGRRFIGTISPSQGKMRIWLRRDSLQNYMDLDVMDEGIRASVPANVDYRMTGKNDHRFDFEARGEDGRVVAGLVLEHIVKALD